MTNQQNIIQLIKQWQELAPDEVKIIDGPCIDAYWFSFDGDEYYCLDTIQLAIQKQIIKREYALEINYWPADYFYSASIWRCRIVYDVADDDTEKSSGWFEADNLAEAMLKAYVEVLKIKQGVK